MSQENVEIVRGIYEAVARRDAAAPFAVYAEDIVWDVSNSRRATIMDSVAYHGHEGVRKFWEEAVSAFGTVDLDVDEVIDAGDRVVALIREHEIGRTSGVPVDTRHVAVWTLADGKVVRMQIFDDREQALKAVGLVE
jgi:ketosteroid isomerase-like protein